MPSDDLRQLGLRYERWGEAHGYERVDGDQCVRRLWGEPHVDFCVCGRAKWMDHPTLWKRGKDLIWVVQPYMPIDHPGVEEALDFASKHGLELRVSSNSCHLPGRTILLEFRLRAEVSK